MLKFRPFKTRPFPIKTRVIWVPGMFWHIFALPCFMYRVPLSGCVWMNVMVRVSCLLGRVFSSMSREKPLLAISFPKANIPIKHPPWFGKKLTCWFSVFFSPLKVVIYIPTYNWFLRPLCSFLSCLGFACYLSNENTNPSKKRTPTKPPRPQMKEIPS